MSLRYYVLGSVILLGILYASREFRSPSEQVEGVEGVEGGPSVSAASSAPRHRLYVPSSSTPQQDDAMKEKAALEKWIQSRLTQQGLKDMTESGQWQAAQSAAL